MDFVLHSMSRPTGLDEVLADLPELLACWLDWRHLLHAKTLEAQVERMHRINVVLLGLDDLVGILQVRETVHEIDLWLELMVRTDDRWALPSEGVRNV